MKKILSVILMSLLFFTGCTNATVRNAIKQSKIAMDRDEYAIALDYLRLAQMEGIEQEEIEKLIKILENYMEAKECFDKFNINGTLSALQEIPEDYKNYSIAGDIEDLKNYISNSNVVDTYYVVNCNQSITLRTEPSVNAHEITQIPIGQAVGFIGNAGNGFYRINYDGIVGYGLAAYLSNQKPQLSGSEYSENQIAQVVNCSQWITLRKIPSLQGEMIASIPLGAYVSFISTAENGFYCIEYMGQRGYALSSYLELR